jgi:hypothetical protein
MIYEFAATQDLHGWEKPWAPGAGNNLLPPPTTIKDKHLMLAGTSYNSTVSDDTWLSLEAGNYVISATYGETL